jgi:putative Ca2+/H+ antiporter (TMEM165/GDT1 family)
MDWKIFAATFTSIFLAEMGDKTQLATMSLAAGSSRWSVFLGSALALCATSLIAVLVGDGLTRLVSPLWLKRGAGALFVVMGVLFLVSKAE